MPETINFSLFTVQCHIGFRSLYSCGAVEVFHLSSPLIPHCTANGSFYLLASAPSVSPRRLTKECISNWHHN